MSAGPPRLGRLLVRLACSRDDTELLLADLAERFDAIAGAKGVGPARRWYWSQALRGLLAWMRPALDQVGRQSWQGLPGDVRLSARVLLRRPLYAIGVAGTLAIGLAAAAAVSSVAWHVWLAPMAFPDPDRVARLFELEPSEADGAPSDRARRRLSPPLLEDLRSHDWTTVDAVAGVSRNVFDWAHEETVSRLQGLTVSPELFTILGIPPLVGRTLTDDRDASEVVLTESFWRGAFGSDPGVVGRGSMTLSGVPHSIVGVVALPSGYPDGADILVRMSFDEEDLVAGMRGARYLDVIARVAPEYRVADAAEELNRFVASLGDRFAIHAGWGGVAVSLEDELLGPYRPVLGMLLAAGSLFLLLAVVNVGGLVAARTVEGRQERSVRLALGASEGRLLRAGTVESFLLGGLGGAVALVLAYWLLAPLVALVPADVPRIGDVRLTSALAGGVIAFALASGGLVGVLGHLLARDAGPAVARARGRTSSGLAGRGFLVAGQIALTTLLATSGAGILRQMVDLRAVDIGFRAEGVVATQIVLGGDSYPTPSARLGYWRRVLEVAEARGLAVAIGTNMPAAGSTMTWGYRVDDASEEAFAQYHIVSSDFFRVMGIEVAEGRPFGRDDHETSEPVVIVNEVVAAEHFPGESAIGKSLTVLRQVRTVVGVVRPTRHFGPGQEAPGELYVPHGQDPWPHAQVVLRGDGAASAGALALVLAEVDPVLDVPPPAPYGRYVSAWLASLRLQLIIVGVLAAVGTLLATLGLYALVAYRVGARRREIGVRMALGASDSRLFYGVVRQGVALATGGMLVGFGAWYASLPLTRDLLGEIDVRDPWAPLAVAILVGVVATLASALPARNSVTVDPAVTLRAE